jgi:hypothetical protein
MQVTCPHVNSITGASTMSDKLADLAGPDIGSYTNFPDALPDDCRSVARVFGGAQHSFSAVMAGEEKQP